MRARPVIQRRDIQLQSQQNALLPWQLRAGACRRKSPTAAAAAAAAAAAVGGGGGCSQHLVLCALCQQGLPPWKEEKAKEK